MSFVCLITTIGQAKVAAAIASGIDLPLTQMAVGDGNGNPTTPAVGQTALVREVYRSSLTSIGVDAQYPNRTVAEMTIPYAQGGWTIREVGVFDSDGDLIAVGNYPETYKPLNTEGAARDLTIRVLMQVESTEAVTLGIDPSGVFATQAWVDMFYALGVQAPGGTTNQVLRKKSNADGDVEWADPTAAVQVIVDVLKEEQTLAAGQTVVNFANITTNGLALYIEGIRDEDFTANSSTQITLGRTFPAGTKITGYQNTPVNPSYFARKDLANTFTAANTFDQGVTVSVGGGLGPRKMYGSELWGLVLASGEGSNGDLLLADRIGNIVMFVAPGGGEAVFGSGSAAQNPTANQVRISAGAVRAAGALSANQAGAAGGVVVSVAGAGSNYGIGFAGIGGRAQTAVFCNADYPSAEVMLGAITAGVTVTQYVRVGPATGGAVVVSGVASGAISATEVSIGGGVGLFGTGVKLRDNGGAYVFGARISEAAPNFYLTCQNSAGACGLMFQVRDGSLNDNNVLNIQADGVSVFTGTPPSPTIPGQVAIGGGIIRTAGAIVAADSIYSSNGTVQAILSHGASAIVGAYSNHDLNIRSNNIDRMRISAAGVVDFRQANCPTQLVNGVIFTGTASNTIASPASYTTALPASFVGTATLPANCFVAGRRLRVRLRGIVAGGGVAISVGVQFTLGGATMASAVVNETIGGGGHQFEFNGEAICGGAGASASFMADGKTEIFSTSDATNDNHVASGASAIRTVDTTGALAVDIQVYASGAATFTVRGCTIELIG